MTSPTTTGTTEIVLKVHPGQEQALASAARVVAVLAGTGGGKSTIGPPWLCAQIARHWYGNGLGDSVELT